jgi:hypothetical protein
MQYASLFGRAIQRRVCKETYEELRTWNLYIGVSSLKGQRDCNKARAETEKMSSWITDLLVVDPNKKQNECVFLSCFVFVRQTEISCVEHPHNWIEQPIMKLITRSI